MELPKAIYFCDCGLNGGQVGAICWKVWAKGDVRTFWGLATALDFTEEDIMEPKSTPDLESSRGGEGFLEHKRNKISGKANSFMHYTTHCSVYKAICM